MKFRPNCQTRRRPRWAFSLVEVSIAVGVLGLTVASSLVAMRVGFAMIETARDGTLASQILQSEMENLRLKLWDEIRDLKTGPFDMEASFLATPSAARFVCARIVDVPNTNIRQITLEVTWTSMNGRSHDRRYVTYFSKEGLNDYYYRAIR